jgi:C4-dicarboxylate-specific signal transduction histidine kinase
MFGSIGLLHNRLNNAFDAVNSKAGGKRWVRIVAAAQSHANDEIQNQMRIDVIDGGPGVAEEHRSHVMDAFFTTKPMGAGLGVGLSHLQDHRTGPQRQPGVD